MKAYPLVATSLLALDVLGIQVGVGFAQATPPVQTQPAVRAYTVINLGTLGGLNSYPLGINNRGEVAGKADTGTQSLQDAFIYSDGKMLDLGETTESANAINSAGKFVGKYDVEVKTEDPLFPTDHVRVAFLNDAGKMHPLSTQSSSEAFAINAAGAVAGIATQPRGEEHAFIYAEESLTDLGVLSARRQGLPPMSKATGLNDLRQAVGWSTVTVGDHSTIHAFCYAKGAMQDLGTLGGDESAAYAINNDGQIVGRSEIKPGSMDMHAFLYANEKMADLGAMGHTQSTARAINAGGQIVGCVWDWKAGEISDQRAFLYSDGAMFDLNSLTLPGTLAAAGLKMLTQARGINDRGQIVGIATDADGNNVGFLLTPAALDAPKITRISPVIEPAKRPVFTFAAGPKEMSGFIMQDTVRNEAYIDLVYALLDIDAVKVLPPIASWSVDPADWANGKGFVNAKQETLLYYPIASDGSIQVVAMVDPAVKRNASFGENAGLYSDLATIVYGRMPAMKELSGHRYEPRIVSPHPPFASVIWLKALDPGGQDMVYPVIPVTDSPLPEKLMTVPEFLKAYGPQVKEELNAPGWEGP